MRRVLVSLLLVGWMLLHASCALAADRARALAIVEEAIKAQGGADKLARLATARRVVKGKFFLGQGEATFTDESQYGLPGRMRQDVAVIDQRILFVVNRDRGWRVVGGKVEEIGKVRLEEFQESLHALNLTTLLPLRSDKQLELDVAGTTEVEGKKAPTIKVSSKGHEDVFLAFDPMTKLLVKMSRKGRSAGLPGLKETLFADYKDFDGLKLPAREIELLNGKKVSEVTSVNYLFPPRVEERAFAKP